MLPSSSGKGKAKPHRDRSPFSSPYTGLLSSPIAARRGSLEERRRPAGDFEDVSPAPRIRIEEEAVEEGDEEDDADEDEDAETSPLLPIFSAAHLGTSPPIGSTDDLSRLIRCRCSTSLQHHPHDTPVG